MILIAPYFQLNKITYSLRKQNDLEKSKETYLDKLKILQAIKIKSLPTDSIFIRLKYRQLYHRCLFLHIIFIYFFVLQLHLVFLSCVNVFQTDLRTALILPVQPCPGLANLSPMPNHLFSITPQTNWSVTPLSGPRLHFSSHPSPPKHSFFFTVTFSASQTPSLSSCVPSMLNCLYLSRLNHISLSLLHTGAHGHAHIYRKEKAHKISAHTNKDTCSSIPIANREWTHALCSTHAFSCVWGAPLRLLKFSCLKNHAKKTIMRGENASL